MTTDRGKDPATDGAPDDQPPWHAMPADAVLDRLDSSADGISDDEAAARLERYGPNRLDLTPPASAWKILVDQFRSVVVLLLVAATGIAWALGDPAEAVAIAAVLVINAALGFVTEFRARRAMEGLRSLEVPHAVVVRGGRERQIESAGLVPGDVIVVEAGQSVPADGRILDATELRTGEAPLTGESQPVDKRADEELEEDTVLADRVTMLYQSTAVSSGTARVVVTATGGGTEVGKIGTLTSGVEEERTPLEKRLDTLGRRLVWLTLAIAGVIVLIGRLRGMEWGLVLETGIALAIAAVPEGLPAVATITLAIGVRRMAKRQALVRRPPAVEALGSATVVCADKTGTLTAGEMMVTTIIAGGREVEVTGESYEPAGEFRAGDGAVDAGEDGVLAETLRIGALANRADVERDGDGWNVRGDPTEAALLVAAQKGGLDRERLREEWPEEAEIPFSSERQWMATFHQSPDGGGLVALVKGAPARIVERSTRLRTRDGDEDLDDEGREGLLEQNRALAVRGLRVLALASAAVEEAGEDGVKDLTFVGLVGIQDPPAPDVPETVQRFRDAGIRTVMITGDQRLTAVAIARQLGLADADADPEEVEAIDGRELAELDEATLDERVAHTAVFNRVSPADKLRIVESMQRIGEIAAMLGDGVNDAAALKRADIGVAMGVRGTDAAKEAAAVVLEDDRFATIGAAVEEGRVIFDNIGRFVFYLFSCNVAEILVILIAIVAGLPTPLLPLQLLWLNIVTDTFTALSLAMEPGAPDVMKRPPRDPQQAILSRRFLGEVALFGGLITAAALAAYLWALLRSSDTARLAGTFAFMTLALTQIFHLINARSDKPIRSLAELVRNRWALGAIVFTLGLQLLAVYFAPLAGLLRLEPLAGGDWAIIVPLALAPLVLGQVYRWITHRRFSTRSSRGREDARDGDATRKSVNGDDAEVG